MPIDDGVIKFDHSDYQVTPALDKTLINTINDARSKLYALNLIGEYQEAKVGFGNISQRFDFQVLRKSRHPQFIISGSQTGHLATLNGEHYTRVVDYDLQLNKICAMGPNKEIAGASSESLTHAAIYECNEAIQAVIHIHSPSIWRGMLSDKLCQTPKEVPYGTIEMANAVKQKVAGQCQGYLAMAGHEDGVITYGQDFPQAMKICLELYNKYETSPLTDERVL